MKVIVREKREEKVVIKGGHMNTSRKVSNPVRTNPDRAQSEKFWKHIGGKIFSASEFPPPVPSVVAFWCDADGRPVDGFGDDSRQVARSDDASSEAGDFLPGRWGVTRGGSAIRTDVQQWPTVLDCETIRQRRKPNFRRCWRCSSREHVDVTTHGGENVRRDCKACGAVWGFVAWRGVLTPIND